MKNWADILLRIETPIIEAIRNLNRTAAQICLVVDEGNRLLGTVTDGDIRRGIACGISLEAAVAEIMNRSPHAFRVGDDRNHMLAIMRRDRLWQMPIVDADGRVVGLESAKELLHIENRRNVVVLMAGGEGRRLRPLTETVPKPLLPVGPRPILETIMIRFIEQGFRRFYISVNYKAELVEKHFGNGQALGVEIEYLRESQQLGTAGALGLLPEWPADPLIVMNGDILTTLDYGKLLDFHVAHQAAATMAVREHLLEIPYGVVRLDGPFVREIEEKPVLSQYVNAGIYVLAPQSLDLIPTNQPYDMPQLFEDLGRQGRRCAGFPIEDYWRDIGQHDDFSRANDEFHGNFR